MEEDIKDRTDIGEWMAIGLGCYIEHENGILLSESL